MSRIFISGDCHGLIDAGKFGADEFLANTPTADDYVIICGDFGCCWNGGKHDKFVQEWWNDKPWTTLFVDGNHENHAILDAMPVEEWHGGKVHKISDKIIHLMRGQVFDICGHSFFTFGGASSHDKEWRKVDIDWWEREMPSYAEMAEGMQNLERYYFNVDYVITHCAPSSFVRALGYEADCLTNYFETLADQLAFSKWFFGHYHFDQMIGDGWVAAYNNIYEITGE